MSKEVIRFKDTGESLADMLDEILVSCPRCACCAQIILAPHTKDEKFSIVFAKRRLICSHCGLTKEWVGSVFQFQLTSPIRDPYFSAPLWFQMSCCGHTLWALNRRHLRFLESYIEATLREEQAINGYSFVAAKMTNVLPKWMKIAKHREAILSDLAKLKRK